MKKLVALALVAMVAVGVQAQVMYPDPADTETRMVGIFFGQPWSSETTNNNVIGVPTPMYAVILNADQGTRGFELGIRGTDGLVFGTNVFFLGLEFAPGVGPLNLGTMTNILCGYAFIQPFNPEGMVVATWNVMFMAGGTIELGPAQPSSCPLNPRPAILGENPDHLFCCNYATYVDEGPHTTPPTFIWVPIATVLGGGVVATEDRSLSSVKALFQ